jgi:hypothetical protein
MVVQSDQFHLNDFPLRTDKAIVVTSWDGHRLFLKKTLEMYMETGAYVICSYDCKGEYPRSDIMKIPHVWVFKHKTYGAGKRVGWLWDTVYAAGVLLKFNEIKVVFTANGDCIWENPKGINEIIKLLGDDCDMMASSMAPSLTHTCSVMFKAYVYQRFADYITETLKNNIPESYSPEVVLRDFIKYNDIKNRPPPIQPMFPPNLRYKGIDHYCSYNQDSTWKRVLGFRNLGAEHKQSPLEHLEPIPKKYIDFQHDYFTQHEQLLHKYYETDDRRWLYKYYAEGEDSYWNRRYYSIEYYGNQPLRDDSKRKELGPPSERLGHFIRKEFQSFILKDDEYKNKWKKVIKGSK